MKSEGTNNKSFNSDTMVRDSPPSYDQANASAPYPTQIAEVPANYPHQSYPAQAPPLQGSYSNSTVYPMTTTTTLNYPYPGPGPGVPVSMESMTPEHQQLAYQQAQMQAQALADAEQKRIMEMQVQRKKTCLFIAVPMIILMILAVVLGNVLPRVL